MEKWFENEPPGDIIKRTFYEKTVNLSITLPADMLQQVTNWGIRHGITSRSMAIQWFILQGTAHIREAEAEMRLEQDERLKKEKVARLTEEKVARLTEEDKEDLRALDHVYDVEEE